MSRKITPHFPDVKGIIVEDFARNGLIAAGPTVPTDGVAGYATGCLFAHTDGGEDTALYVNDGSATACDFNPLPTALTGSSAELNQAVGDGDEVITGANVITAAENGKTFFLDSLTGGLQTLPTPALGLKFTFVVKTTPTSVGYTIGGGTANNIFGSAVGRDGAAGVAGSGEDTITLVANQTLPGDVVHLWCDGTNWYAEAQVDVAAGITFTT